MTHRAIAGTRADAYVEKIPGDIYFIAKPNCLDVEP